MPSLQPHVPQPATARAPACSRACPSLQPHVPQVTPLSEQNLVDCVSGMQLPADDTPCCMGCKGGEMDDAFDYLVRLELGSGLG